MIGFEELIAGRVSNRSSIEKSGGAGCIWCKAVFSSKDITRFSWQNRDTMECPCCWLDQLIPLPVTVEMLMELHSYLYSEPNLDIIVPLSYRGAEFPEGMMVDGDLEEYLRGRIHSPAPDPGF